MPITISDIAQIISKCIPNTMLEVQGETTLAEKLEPWIITAQTTLQTEFLGNEDILNHDDKNKAARIIVLNAFHNAIPALDLVVTPTGFAVISTESLAPASKERVNRLLESTRAQIETELISLLDRCFTYPQWRQTRHGQYFCSTFLSPSDIPDITTSTTPQLINSSTPKLINSDLTPLQTFTTTYRTLRAKAIYIEELIAEQFLGHKLMNRLRTEYNTRKPFHALPLATLIHTAVIELLIKSSTHKLLNSSTPQLSSLWTFCRTIIQRLNSYPEYQHIWKCETEHKFKNLNFKNDIKGSYYF